MRLWTVAALWALAGCGSNGAEVAIYGGARVPAGQGPALSTVAFLSTADDATGFALVEGTGTLVAPGVVVGAAHTCLGFRPRLASFGPELPTEKPWEPFAPGSRYPTLRAVRRCVAHPDYDAEAAHADSPDLRPVNDIALFFVEDVPAGFEPAKVISPDSSLPREVLIAGFGAHEGQFDRLQTDGMEPYELRAVGTAVSRIFDHSLQFQDGPNPGKGSCQGDSGGSVYASVGAKLVLVGIPVSGPACSEGVGINTDLRSFVDWVERTASVALSKVTLP